MRTLNETQEEVIGILELLRATLRPLQARGTAEDETGDIPFARAIEETTSRLVVDPEDQLELMRSDMIPWTPDASLRYDCKCVIGLLRSYQFQALLEDLVGIIEQARGQAEGEIPAMLDLPEEVTETPEAMEAVAALLAQKWAAFRERLPTRKTVARGVVIDG